MRHERELRLAGFEHIAGLDEVGRGSLAGPVVAAAVILPERHRIKGIRECPVKRFPYALYYRELSESIWVAAVAHQKRRPAYWSRRKPSSHE